MTEERAPIQAPRAGQSIESPRGSGGGEAPRSSVSGEAVSEEAPRDAAGVAEAPVEHEYKVGDAVYLIGHVLDVRDRGNHVVEVGGVQFTLPKAALLRHDHKVIEGL